MIVVSVQAATTAECIRKLQTAQAMADWVELRLDYGRKLDLKAVLKQKTKPVIATCRSFGQGGCFRGSEESRLQMLAQADALGADYIDLELESAKEFSPQRAKLIISYHDFAGFPDHLHGIHEQIATYRPAFIKIAVKARALTDNLKMFEFLRGVSVPTAAFCMGLEGRISRVLGKKFGSAFTYACLNEQEQTAEGQWTVTELRDRFGYDTLGETTQIYGLVGDSLSHSLSPIVHNAAFRALQMDAVYLPLQCPDFGRFFQSFGAADIGLIGLSVTAPFKEAAVEAADLASAEGQRIGAVNTLRRGVSGWEAINTDFAAIRTLLQKHLGEKEGLHFGLIGAGGVARSFARAAQQRKCRLTIYARDSVKARSMADEFGGVAQGMDALPLLRHDVLVNATPLGTAGFGEELTLPANVFHPEMVVVDCIYKTSETMFCAHARAAGAAVVAGLDLFLEQAYAQFRYWTHESPPKQIMREAALAALHEWGFLKAAE